MRRRRRRDRRCWSSWRRAIPASSSRRSRLSTVLRRRVAIARAELIVELLHDLREGLGPLSAPSRAAGSRRALGRALFRGRFRRRALTRDLFTGPLDHLLTGQRLFGHVRAEGLEPSPRPPRRTATKPPTHARRTRPENQPTRSPATAHRKGSRPNRTRTRRTAVRAEGLEPPQAFAHQDLNLARLPFPPRPRDLILPYVKAISRRLRSSLVMPSRSDRG